MNYADTLGAPFVLSSNGDNFLMHDRTGLTDRIGQELVLDAFPSPAHVAPLFNGKGWNRPIERAQPGNQPALCDRVDRG